MSDDSSVIEHRSFNPVRDGLAATGLYHSFELPDGRVLNGSMSLEWQRSRLASFGLPDDLRGMRVLDIGPWDGFYTFEMERRGAEVTAIDYVDLDTFRALHRVFESRADYRQMDVYEMDPADLGTFDIVLCLGVLYHLKHPLLALEKICAVTRGVCIIDTFVIDGGVAPVDRSPLPYLEFYERGELGGQLDNWCGPTVAAVEALARSAGFARTEVLRVTDSTACVAAHRKWNLSPAAAQPPTTLHGLTCHVRPGRSFQSSKEEYIELWCAVTSPESPLLAIGVPGSGWVRGGTAGRRSDSRRVCGECSRAAGPFRGPARRARPDRRPGVVRTTDVLPGSAAAGGLAGNHCRAGWRVVASGRSGLGLGRMGDDLGKRAVAGGGSEQHHRRDRGSTSHTRGRAPRWRPGKRSPATRCPAMVTTGWWCAPWSGERASHYPGRRRAAGRARPRIACDHSAERIIDRPP